MAIIIGAAAGGFVLIMIIIIIIVVVVVKKNRRRGAQGHGLPASRAKSSHHVQMHVKGASEMHTNPLGQRGKDDAKGHPDNQIL